MPDDQGKLSVQELEAFQKWLQDHWSGSKVCPVCQKNQWIVGEHVVTTIKISNKGDILLGGETYPLVLLVCGNCGNTLSFNARVMRLMKDDSAPQDD